MYITYIYLIYVFSWYWLCWLWFHVWDTGGHVVSWKILFRCYILRSTGPCCKLQSSRRELYRLFGTVWSQSETISFRSSKHWNSTSSQLKVWRPYFDVFCSCRHERELEAPHKLRFRAHLAALSRFAMGQPHGVAWQLSSDWSMSAYFICGYRKHIKNIKKHMLTIIFSNPQIWCKWWCRFGASTPLNRKMQLGSKVVGEGKKTLWISHDISELWWIIWKKNWKTGIWKIRCHPSGLSSIINNYCIYNL